MEPEKETKVCGRVFVLSLNKNWKKIVAILGVIVAFTTLYLLILPGISWEKEDSVLECNLEVHHHSVFCYDEKGNLTCGLADFVVHKHDESCYDSQGNLVCQLPEIEAHTHDDSCYKTTINEETGKEERVLVCNKPEIELHVHGPECYEVSEDEDGNPVKKLICGKLEVREHKHGPGCFTSKEETTQDDGKDEAEGAETTPKDSTDGKPETLSQSESEAVDLGEGMQNDGTSADGTAGEVTSENDGDSAIDSKVPTDLTSAADDSSEEVRIVPNIPHTAVYVDRNINLETGSNTGTGDKLLIDDPYDESALLKGAITVPDESLISDDGTSGKTKPKLAAKAPTKATGNWSVNVDKSWSDGSKEHDPVTVQLWTRDTGGNETNTGKTVTLNKGNNWKTSFTGLSKNDGFEYFVKEVPLDNWDTTIQSSEPVVNETWTRASEVESGETYVIVPSGYQYGLTVNRISYGTVSGVTWGYLPLNSTTITGTVPDNMRWTFEESEENPGFYFIINEGYNQYFCNYTSSGTSVWGTTSSANATSIVGGYHYPYRYSSSNTFKIYAGSSYTNNLMGTGYYFRLYKLSATETGQNISIVNKLKPGSDEDPNKISLDHSKKIDYLGDGEANEDTSVQTSTESSADLDDLYRLYLDVTGTSEPPVDLLIVLDRSGSMSKEDLVNSAGATQTRVQGINDFLNGEGSKQGFIEQFIAANPENTLSVVDFGGDGYVSNTTQSGGYVYTKDASLVADWTNSDADIRFTNASEGTNYSAGLAMAEVQLKKLNAANHQGHRKIMVFLSDGVPTFYMDEYGNRQGNGGEKDGNEDACVEPTIRSINEFIKDNPDVYVYTVGFYGEEEGSEFDPTVLKYMATKAGGTYHQAASAKALTESMLSLTAASNVAITDYLSVNVDYYEHQPDAKLVMKDLDTDREIVLYENGTVTEAGKGIVKDITFVKADSLSEDEPNQTNGRVRVEFEQYYNLKSRYKYILSYNIQVSHEAYDDYIQNNGAYTGLGDGGTDAGTNHTSSGARGLLANFGANVTYDLNGYPQEEIYDIPVIQVSDVQLNILKTTMDGQSTLSGAKFTLYRKAEEGEPGGTSVDGLDGKYIKVQDMTSDDGGKASSEEIEAGIYYLVEDFAPKGYSKLTQPIKISIAKREVKVLTGTTSVKGQSVETGSPVLTVMNGNTYKLPETGGVGKAPFEISGAMLILIAIFYALGKRKKRRRDSG